MAIKKKPLIELVQNYFLSLGEGFALVGQKVRLPIEGKNYYIDLLFYHIKLRCFYIIAVQNTKFKPVYVGKLDLYLSSIDKLWRLPEDNPAIGILLCKTKENFTARYILHDGNEPKNLTGKLPSTKKIEYELKKTNIEKQNPQDKIVQITQET